MKITLSAFRGENRALHPLSLPDGVGVGSSNQNPVRGDLRPLKSPLAVATVPGGRNTIYRMGRDVASDSQYWLSWSGVVDAVRGSIADDTTERTYYTGDGVPKWTDNTMGLAGAPYPTAWRQLGIPAPATAALLAVIARVPVAAGSFVVGTSYAITTVGTTDFVALGATASTVGVIFKATGVGAGTGTATVSNLTTESRYYAYTYVSDKGEEGAPSPVSLELVCKTDDAIDITALAAPPAGNFGIDRIRVYRTQSGTTGEAEFFFLREIISTLTATTDDARVLGEVMPSTTWLAPPADLTGLIGLWNGIMAGITGNAVRFCEAYKPYAWPIAYEVMPPDTKPVALAKFGQNLLVLTTGKPVLVTGGSPDAMDSQPLELAEACVSARSAVSLGHGVAWACPDGLAYYGSGGAKIITTGLMTRDDWQAIKPATIVAGSYEGAYLGFYTVSGVTKGFLIDPLNPTGIFFTDIPGQAVFFDDLQDQLYVLDGTSVKKWNAGAALTASFKSKLFRTPKPTGFACAEVVADAYPVSFRLYADGALKHTQAVASGAPFRLPSGFMAQEWQLELSTTGAVQGVAMAQSMQELAQL